MKKPQGSDHAGPGAVRSGNARGIGAELDGGHAGPPTPRGRRAGRSRGESDGDSLFVAAGRNANRVPEAKDFVLASRKGGDLQDFTGFARSCDSPGRHGAPQAGGDSPSWCHQAGEALTNLVRPIPRFGLGRRSPQPATCPSPGGREIR